MKRIEVIGSKVGSLLVISEHSRSRNNTTRYNCKCDCGNDCIINKSHLLNGRSKTCGCSHKKTGKENKRWKGYGDISLTYFNNLKVSALSGRRKIIEFNLTIEEAWDLFLEQNKKCKLSGLELIFATNITNKYNNASLDRIDSSKGYIKENVQWVHKDINLMKNRLDNNYFIKMCKYVANN